MYKKGAGSNLGFNLISRPAIPKQGYMYPKRYAGTLQEYVETFNNLFPTRKTWNKFFNKMVGVHYN